MNEIFDGNPQDMYSVARMQKLMETYDPYIQAVSKNTENFTDEKAGKLAMMLSNTEVALGNKRLLESTQVSNVGEFKKHAMALISATFPNLIAEELVSIQPLQQKVGQIFFLKFLYGSTKSGVKKGDLAFDRFQAPGTTTNYSSELVESELLCEGDGSTVDFTGNLAYTPLRPGTVSIVCGSVNVRDDGAGKLVGTGVDASSVIDYTSGAYTIKFTTAPSQGVEVEANYDTNFEFAPANSIPEMDLKIEEAIIKARPRKLKTLYSFDAAYDLQISQGINMDDALMEAAVQSIKTEIDGEILADLYNQAGLTSTWNKKWMKDSGITSRDYAMTFIEEIVSAGNAMFSQTRRYKPNFLVVGKWGADTLMTIGAPRFVGSGVTNPEGPHFMGTLDGNIRVYHNPYYADNQYLLGHKGTSFLDAGYVYAPYLPIMNTQLLMMEDFLNRRGYATSYGKKMIMPTSYIKGTITNS